MDESNDIPSVKVTLSGKVPGFFPDDKTISKCLSEALKPILAGLFSDLRNYSQVEIDATITDDRHIQKINREFRGKDTSTDVLSFPLMDVCDGNMACQAGDQPLQLGDLVFSHETIIRQAEERQLSFSERFTECFVHGLLHLLGWNHEDEMDREKMENMEDTFLDKAVIMIQKCFGATEHQP
jgi:probable rRNA maturation factor